MGSSVQSHGWKWYGNINANFETLLNGSVPKNSRSQQNTQPKEVSIDFIRTKISLSNDIIHQICSQPIFQRHDRRW